MEEGNGVSFSLEGKVVFVTGASSGIGAATARAFAPLGVCLLLCARRADKLQEMEPELRRLGAKDVFSFELDVRDRDEVEGTINTLPDHWSRVEVLVNNAGLSRGLTKLYKDDVEDWEEMIDTNVKGLLYVTRTVVPGMVERGSGHVINLGSIAGHDAYPNGGVYCATKAAERSLPVPLAPSSPRQSPAPTPPCSRDGSAAVPPPLHCPPQSSKRQSPAPLRCHAAHRSAPGSPALHPRDSRSASG